MQRTIRTSILAFVFLLLNHALRANSDISRPVSKHRASFLSHLKNLDRIFQTTHTGNISGGKICSCQILDLQSSNYTHKNIALFAERTSHGQHGRDLGLAKDAIEKEKKHLKELFYDKLSVVGKLTETGDCRSLYIKLKGANENLVMYDILDADIQQSR